jgi:hypothetical protein
MRAQTTLKTLKSGRSSPCIRCPLAAASPIGNLLRPYNIVELRFIDVTVSLDLTDDIKL